MMARIHFKFKQRMLDDDWSAPHEISFFMLKLRALEPSGLGRCDWAFTANFLTSSAPSLPSLVLNYAKFASASALPSLRAFRVQELRLYEAELAFTFFRSMPLLEEIDIANCGEDHTHMDSYELGQDAPAELLHFKVLAIRAGAEHLWILLHAIKLPRA
jgi:hypothetical protein